MMRLLLLSTAAVIVVIVTIGLPVVVEGLSNNNNHKSAIVVGSGPSGLASALILSKKHGYKVTVLETTERKDLLTYDPRKGYPFLINPRGQLFTKLFEQIQISLEGNAVATDGGSTPIVSIPANPTDVVNTEPKLIAMFKSSGTRYWIRRHEFTKLLLDFASQDDNITLLNGVYCKSLRSSSSSKEEEIVVSVVDINKNNNDSSTSSKKTDEEKEYYCSLLIAADGMRSAVRECLSSTCHGNSDGPLPGWKNSNPRGFKVRKWFSPASGLKFKTLNMNPDATIPIGDGTTYKMPFNTQTFHTIKSVNNSPTTALSLGILPSRESTTRALNVIRPLNHEVWKIRDGSELRDWFAKAFPRFDFSSDSPLIKQTEFDRFAAEEALTLPPCQYSPQLYTASPSGNAAVIVLGDAAHTFPPDLGEGVNSGLEDVVALDKALSDGGSNKSLGEIAMKYSKERVPEVSFFLFCFSNISCLI